MGKDTLAKALALIRGQIREQGYENLLNINISDIILSLGFTDQNQNQLLANYYPLVLTYILIEDNQF